MKQPQQKKCQMPFRVETETSISKHLRQVFSILVWLTGVVQGFFDGHPFVRSVLRYALVAMNIRENKVAGQSI